MPIKRHINLVPSVQCPQCSISMQVIRNNHRETRYQCSSCDMQRVVYKQPAPIQCPPDSAA